MSINTFAVPVVLVATGNTEMIYFDSGHYNEFILTIFIVINSIQMTKVVLILLFSANAFSQNTTQQYNKSVNEAKQHIVSGQYQAAITVYENAFKQQQEPFNADLYNAAICWLKVGNWQNGKKYLNKLARRGVSLETLTETGFLLLQQDTEWQQYAAFYNQIYEEPKPSLFVEQFVSLVVQLDSLDNNERNRFIQSTFQNSGDSTIAKFVRRDGSSTTVTKTLDSTGEVVIKKVNNPLSPELQLKEDRINYQFDSLLQVTKDNFFNYTELNGWPDEVDVGAGSLSYSKTMFFKQLSNFVHYAPTITMFQKQGKQSFEYANPQRFSATDSVRFYTHLQTAVYDGKIPPLAALKLGYAYEFNRLPTEDIVFIRTEPDDNCLELMSKYNARFVQRSRKNALSAERFDELKKQLNITDRENLTRLHIFNNSLNDSFIFELNKYSEEAVLPTCFTLKEFLETATLVE